MTIVSQNYNNFITNLIHKHILEATSNISINSYDDVFNYINVIQSFDSILSKAIISSLKAYLEELDYNYTISNERKRKYHIKDYRSRTILTIFGEFTYSRHFFKSKLDDSSFCYVDRQLGLQKYQYFDPYIRSLIVSKASENSISLACREINEMIGNRINLTSKPSFLSRQSARNIILTSSIATVSDTTLNTPDELYILADEKWIATQFQKDWSKHSKHSHNKKVMVKSIVVFDGFSGFKRRTLLHKKVFASDYENIITQSLDYIFTVYDTSKIKRIFVMGDGAKWIKALPQYYKFESTTQVYYCLDKFHFKQALHHLAMNSNYEKYLLNYILTDNKKAFNQLVSFIKENNLKREDIINKKYDYIISNWNDIRRLYQYKMSCPMESQISHNIAALTSSRPKGYSYKMLRKIIRLRLAFINKQNIKKLFLTNFNSSEIKHITVEHLNFDIFYHYKTFIPIYQNKLFTPSIGQYFY
ncbi:MAG: hypothetical protein HFH08_04235 [Bacilli bacterium]|nr:hypothetical protein [Bacilli bacterium]